MYSNVQKVSFLLLGPGHFYYGFLWWLKGCYHLLIPRIVTKLELFSILLCHQIWLWLCNLCIYIVAASFVSLHLLLNILPLFPSLPSILIGNFQGSSSHLNVHRQNPHEAPFYSSNRAPIRKHTPASDYCCFISHIPIEPSNTSLEQHFVLTPSLSLFLLFHL